MSFFSCKITTEEKEVDVIIIATLNSWELKTREI